MRTPFWSTFTAQISGTATVSSVGLTEVDTDVYVWTGTCEDPSLVGYNDDAEGFQSSLTFDVTSGTTYIVNWGNAWSGGQGHDWSLSVDPLPSTPENLTALGGLGRVYLEFSPYNHENTSGGTGNRSAVDATLSVEEHVQMRADKIAAGKVENSNA